MSLPSPECPSSLPSSTACSNSGGRMSPYSPPLRIMSSRDAISAATVSSLAEGGGANLLKVAFRSSCDAAALAEVACWCPKLRHLVLPANGCQSAVASIAGGGVILPASLRVFELKACGAAPVKSPAARARAAVGHNAAPPPCDGKVNDCIMRGLSSVLLKLPKLKRLVIPAAPQFADECFLAGAESNIENVRLLGSAENFDVSALANLPQLRCVELKDARPQHLTSFATLCSRNIQRIQLCGNCTDAAFVAFGGLASLPQLSELNIKYSDISDAALQALANGECHRSLLILKLEQCPNLTNTGIVAICHGLVSMHTLHLRHCNGIDNLDGSLSFIPNLLSLCISSKHVHNSTVDFLSTASPALVQLDLSECGSVEGNSFTSLQKLTSLQELSLSHTRLTDFALSALADTLDIHKLWINYCRNLTATATSLLAKMHHLQLLETSGCCFSQVVTQARSPITRKKVM
ncbi:hypothetical protein Pelo_11692 [Pelomyxa schiedti]|nr:hypothetical protein Pelo_11692 [Pelomyxa schiedti]